jgi:predicted RNase H-like nuclease
MSLVAGVDGRRGGWALALVRFTDAGLIEELTWDVVDVQDAAGALEVFRRAREAGAEGVGVDAPIGLPVDRWRRCDLEAKRALGRASARVFLAPPREVLAAPDYGSARALARLVLHGRSISAQAYGIRRIVLAVDEALASRSTTGRWARRHVVEVHPELSFIGMSGQEQPLPPKRTPAGRAAREAVISGWLRSGATLDAPVGTDHLDALAVAWSAHRWVQGRAGVLGGDVDQLGLPMRIVI